MSTTISQGRVFGRSILAMAACLAATTASALVVGPIVPEVPGSFGAVITYGNTSMGVNGTGELNYSGNGPGGNLLYGIYRAGVGDAISPGCPCEGWGVALTDSLGRRSAVFANQSAGSGGFGTDNSFGFTDSTATSLVNMGDLPVSVRHAYGPSFAADIFQVQVTITNNGNSALSDLVYRRAMDWDVPPTEFNEYVSHGGVQSSLVANGGNLLYAGNNGFASSDPRESAAWDNSLQPTFSSPTLIDTTNRDFDKAGPSDHGSVFDFSFGTLNAGASRIFNIYYGSAANEASARSKLAGLGVNLYSLGQPSGVAGSGGGEGPPTLTLASELPLSEVVPTDVPPPADFNPADQATYVFAFGGVGGVEPGTTQDVPILPFVAAPGQFVFDAPPARRWYDPPFAEGFTITVTGGDLISITAPTGFSDLKVVVGGVVVDSDFDGGETYTFAGGVRSFKIGGLSLDTAAPGFSTAFPLFIDFEPTVTGMTWTADVSAVPEPMSAAMLLPGLAVLGALARRRARVRG